MQNLLSLELLRTYQTTGEKFARLTDISKTVLIEKASTVKSELVCPKQTYFPRVTVGAFLFGANMDQFFVYRHDFTDELFFGCRFGSVVVYFYPIIDEPNSLLTEIAISSDILHLNPEDVAVVKEIFNEFNNSMKIYFEVMRGIVSYPYSREALELIQRFPLNDAEKAKLFDELAELTFIYLIKDRSTGFVKIGRSNEPEKRLKTLIKQDTLLPTANEFELLFFWEARNYLETVLHKAYEKQRVRGEWFNLSDEDIKTIRKHYLCP